MHAVKGIVMKMDVQHLGKGAFIKIPLYVYNISILEINCETIVNQNSLSIV